MKAYFHLMMTGIFLVGATSVMGATIKEITDRAQSMDSRQDQIIYLKREARRALDDQRYDKLNLISQYLRDVQLERSNPVGNDYNDDTQIPVANDQDQISPTDEEFSPTNENPSSTPDENNI